MDTGKIVEMVRELVLVVREMVTFPLRLESYLVVVCKAGVLLLHA